MWLLSTVYRVGLELKKKKNRWGPDHICPKLKRKKKKIGIIFLYYKEAESLDSPASAQAVFQP